MTPVRLEPAALRSRVKHSIIEPLQKNVVMIRVKSNFKKGRFHMRRYINEPVSSKMHKFEYAPFQDLDQSAHLRRQI